MPRRLEDGARDGFGERARKLERRLEIAERRLEETQALTRVGSWEWKLPERRTSWSKEHLRIYGRGVDEPPPSIDEVLAAVHPDDRPGVRKLLDDLQVRAGPFDHTYRIVGADGEPRHLRALGRTICDAAGRPVRAYGTTQDVTELKRSQRTLEETQSLAHVGSWEWLISPDGQWQATYSRQMQRILGRDPDGPPPTREELIARVHPDDLPAFEALIARIQSTPGGFEHNYRIVDADGRVRHMQARGEVEADADGQPTRTHGTTQDITELKESQAQLEQARRLEAVGQLAGGVAHDFNNLLAVILNYAECAIASSGDGETIAALREIERAALTAADLTKRLLLFSRRDSDEPRRVDLAAVVTETEELLRRAIGDHIELTVDAPGGLPEVILGEGQAQQIIVNLVVNARDALPHGGTIAIAVASSPAVPVVMLSVADDGVGMSDEVAEQAFDPFFTTKPRGQGTGLGLAAVYGIVGRAGGHVEIESEPGKGTEITIYLPVAEEEQGKGEEPERPRAAPAAGEGKTVLVVDNEEAVQRVVSHMLVKRGYRTYSATSAAEAEALLDDPGNRVDLLLTDVLMPEVSGRELVARLRKRGVEVPMIFMSGYGQDPSPLGPWDERATVLQKPFKADELLRAVGEALGGAEAGR